MRLRSPWQNSPSSNERGADRHTQASCGFFRQGVTSRDEERFDAAEKPATLRRNSSVTCRKYASRRGDVDVRDQQSFLTVGKPDVPGKPEGKPDVLLF